MRKKIKVGILVSHPIQYYVSIYRELSRDPLIDLLVIYRSKIGVNSYHDSGFNRIVKWDIPLLSGYRYIFLSDKLTSSGVEFNIIKELIQERFDVIIVQGYSAPTYLIAIMISKIIGTKILMRGDTWLRDYHLKGFFKRTFKILLFKFIDGFLSIGTLNAEYYKVHGVPDKRLFFAPFSIDNKFFLMNDSDRLKSRIGLRNKLNINESKICVLFVAKLIPLKRADDLIQAFYNVNNKLLNLHLIVVGSGGELIKLQNLADSLSISDISFVGFKNQSELPAFYSASDIFVLPSNDESWGLVVNEAMASGLPVIVSNQVGASKDLVENKGTGYIFPCGDINEFSKALFNLASSEADRVEMGIRAKNLISNWDSNECAKQFSSTIQFILSK